MRDLGRFLSTLAVSLAATTVQAQQGQFITGGGLTTGSISGTGGLAGGGQGGIGGGAGGTSLTQMESTPNISQLASSANGSNIGSATLNGSNIFASTFTVPGYFANPQYQGIPTNARSGAEPGGFGTTLYPTAAGNAAGGRGGAAGTRGGIRGGAAGNTANQFGTIVSLPVQVSYPAVALFPPAPVTPSKLQSEIAGMIGRSTMIASPGQVQVIADGDTIILRGAAKDADEARLIAGMVRMTSGVRGVVNELTFPKP